MESGGGGQRSSRGDFYTAAEATRILGRADKPISGRRIRQMLQAGELEGYKDDRGRWHVAQHEVHRLKDERRESPEPAAGSPDGPEISAELLDRAFMLERELGRLQGHLELTEQAESTLREELKRERQRADAERERAERLEAELREARESRRGFWSRLFGGSR